MRGRREDRGAVTGLVAALLGVLVLVTAVLAFQGGILVSQRQVQAAADLAALAGAGALQDGRDGCAAADVIAARNGARLVSCRVGGADGREVELILERTGPSLFGRSPHLEGLARAGPVGAAPPG